MMKTPYLKKKSHFVGQPLTVLLSHTQAQKVAEASPKFYCLILHHSSTLLTHLTAAWRGPARCQTIKASGSCDTGAAGRQTAGRSSAVKRGLNVVIIAMVQGLSVNALPVSLLSPSECSASQKYEYWHQLRWSGGERALQTLTAPALSLSV